MSSIKDLDHLSNTILHTRRAKNELNGLTASSSSVISTVAIKAISDIAQTEDSLKHLFELMVIEPDKESSVAKSIKRNAPRR